MVALSNVLVPTEFCHQSIYSLVQLLHSPVEIIDLPLDLSEPVLMFLNTTSEREDLLPKVEYWLQHRFACLDRISWSILSVSSIRASMRAMVSLVFC